ncbi:N-terminal nucleophile aminohydrolase [Lindgomyces ingoldianus]|uniref:N-terminal nucleophile aminohydrolase n=1 Tax=Lindgomyces ingoldianus TaxID=673940 RepID=A0ACB6R060_9PLEO|nr:N-terminal nucleophile aminohydrolase [Lindgomyces ingoldianus]KAF2472180.1 N-terminal nucleophile aminohydrolase [Lindgomyces ingoldianus]
MSALPKQLGTIDGATQTEPLTRKASQSPPQDDVCCIFVHAGAGYHSIQNERIHLQACNEAAAMAMMILRNGGSAIDAVEIAVKVLEDREITNAGYGSNLTMDGVVECDACIVDHHGRSGAVGAVAQIKNPISLARCVLSHSMQTLTLRRVPPNLLVAQGATNFAIEMGIPILPMDANISPAAKERWIRWRADLKAAERKAKKQGAHTSTMRISVRIPDAGEEERVREKMRDQHAQNMLQQGALMQQSISPPDSDQDPLFFATKENSTSPSGPSEPLSDSSTSWNSDEAMNTPDSPTSEQVRGQPMAPAHSIMESSRNAFINSTQQVPTVKSLRDITPQLLAEDSMMQDTEDPPRHRVGHISARRSFGDGSSDDSDSTSSAKTIQPSPDSPHAAAMKMPLPETPSEKNIEDPTPRWPTPLNHVHETAPFPPTAVPSSSPTKDQEDHITDTVGAIAVDSWGNIACGASSGGIGMKHRGRVGPAALIGIGTAVIPVDQDDPERTTVATVTSGTGEHMATTMAATVSAERLYQNIKRTKGGLYQDVTEDEALKNMIENEFMGHPSVKNSNSAGAIGILGVKKTVDGVFLYYGHNTDSFAMASMHSDESKPWCAMSRSSGNGSIAQGGRMLRYRRRKKTTVISR